MMSPAIGWPRSMTKLTTSSPASSARRRSPGPPLRMRPSISDITEAAQHGVALLQRQPDHIGIGAADPAHENRRLAFDGVAAGLALPFAAVQIGSGLDGIKAREGDLGRHDTFGALSVGS